MDYHVPFRRQILQCIQRHPPHPHLHSFPTRRSSDLSPRPRPGRCQATSPTPRRSPSSWRGAASRRWLWRSEEHTLNSSHEWISYAVFCLETKKSRVQISMTTCEAITELSTHYT